MQTKTTLSHGKLTLSHGDDARLRWAGLAYLVIIFAGISSEVMFRPMALSTVDLAGQALALRVSTLLDSVMLIADVILALLLFQVFRAVNAGLAAAATVFRLLQAATIAASLMLQLLVVYMPEMTEALLAAHGAGYDLGLLFFAVNTGLMASLVCHSGLSSKLLPMGLISAAVIYFVGSLAALIAPGLSAAMQPAYIIPLLAELGFAFWLIFGRRLPVPAHI